METIILYTFDVTVFFVCNMMINKCLHVSYPHPNNRQPYLVVIPSHMLAIIKQEIRELEKGSIH